jgi:hypothetical protein
LVLYSDEDNLAILYKRDHIFNISHAAKSHLKGQKRLETNKSKIKLKKEMGKWGKRKSTQKKNLKKKKKDSLYTF